MLLYHAKNNSDSTKGLCRTCHARLDTVLNDSGVFRLKGFTQKTRAKRHHNNHNSPRACRERKQTVFIRSNQIKTKKVPGCSTWSVSTRANPSPGNLAGGGSSIALFVSCPTVLRSSHPATHTHRDNPP